MRDDASPRAPKGVLTTLCVVALFAGACQADGPVVVETPALAKTVGVACTDATQFQTGTSVLTVTAMNGASLVPGFTATVFNNCGRIRVLQDTDNDGVIVFSGPNGFEANAQVFVMAQGGITKAGAELDVAPAPSNTGGLNFSGTPRNKARLTLAGGGNTIVSAVPTLANVIAAKETLPVTVKNNGTAITMQLPLDLAAVRHIVTYNLEDEADLPVAAIQKLGSPAATCGIFDVVDPLCATSEGVGVMRGVDVLAADPFAVLVTSLGDPGVSDADCIIELLTDTDQGLLNASAPCTAGTDTNSDGIKELLLFAEPAFCSFAATVYKTDMIGDGNVFDFIDVRAGAVAIGTYPGGTYPDPTTTALSGSALLRAQQTVTINVTVKELLPGGGANVRSENITLTPSGSNVSCAPEGLATDTYCVVDPTGYPGETGMLVRWTAFIRDLTAGSMREFSVDVKGQDAIPDATKNDGARVMVPADPATVMGVCPVEFGGGRFNPIG
jgi:hypothetical protein